MFAYFTGVYVYLQYGTYILIQVSLCGCIFELFRNFEGNYVSTVVLVYSSLDVCTLDVCTLDVCTLDVCTLDVRTLDVCTLDVCTLNVCTYS